MNRTNPLMRMIRTIRSIPLPAAFAGCLGVLAGASALASPAALAASPEEPLVGGFTAVCVTDKGVQQAATFALKAQARQMQRRQHLKKSHGNPKGHAVRLQLLELLAAQTQIVAGMNYQLDLRVRVNGATRQARAVVWWQAWRKPHPYVLTAWHWQDEARAAPPLLTPPSCEHF